MPADAWERDWCRLVSCLVAAALVFFDKFTISLATLQTAVAAHFPALLYVFEFRFFLLFLGFFAAPFGVRVCSTNCCNTIFLPLGWRNGQRRGRLLCLPRNVCLLGGLHSALGLRCCSLTAVAYTLNLFTPAGQEERAGESGRMWVGSAKRSYSILHSLLGYMLVVSLINHSAQVG